MTEPIQVRLATAADIPGMLRVIRTAFAARRPVDPPADALSDTRADVERALAEGWGVCAFDSERMVGCLLVAHDGEVATLRRVSVVPTETRRGIAKAMIGGAVSLAVDEGLKRVEVLCRREFPELAGWWGKHGFGPLRENTFGIVLGRDLPVAVTVPTPAAMHALGVELAGLLRAGDVIIATGDLGAGKTTLTRGIGEGLDVEGPVISPTFVLSRIHSARGDGPDLVHVDAYRMADADELADIDLDATLSRSVTLVEWGEGIAEWLSDERLEIDIDRDVGDEARRVILTGIGPRWDGVLETIRRKP